jgi:hypothetical protein
MNVVALSPVDRAWLQATKAVFGGGGGMAVVLGTGGVRPVVVAVGLRAHLRRGKKTDLIIDLKDIQ